MKLILDMTIEGLETEIANLKNWSWGEVPTNVIDKISVSAATVVLEQMNRGGADGACCYIIVEDDGSVILNVLPFGIDGLTLKCNLLEVFSKTYFDGEVEEHRKAVVFLRVVADKIEAELEKGK